MTIPKRLPSAMHFINGAFSNTQKKRIMEWMANNVIELFQETFIIRGITGAEYQFHWADYPFAHYLWCAEHLKKQEAKKVRKLPIKYIITKKNLTALIVRHRRRIHEKDHLIAQVLKNIWSGKNYNHGTHCGEYFLKIVLNVIIEEWPYLDTEKCSELVAPSTLSSKITQDQIQVWLETKKKRILKNENIEVISV